MIVLSYMWLLALIPLLTEKDDPEVQWHAKHGLVLMVAGFAALVIVVIVGWVVPDFGCTGCLLHSAAWAAIVAVQVIAIVKGVNGGRLIIPGVSQYADRF